MKTEIKKKPLEYYFELKYPITLHPSPEGGYGVEIEDLPGCISQGETVEEAVRNIEEACRLWLEVAYEDGLDIPLPREEREYSGNIIVRGSKSLHRRLDQLADREGISLNQYIVTALSRTVGVEENRKTRARSRRASKN